MVFCKWLPLDRKWHDPIRSLSFFFVFYLAILFLVEPDLIYCSFGIRMPYPTFYTGWDFFRPFLEYPGGTVDYFAAFLLQGYYGSWLGALIVTILTWGTCRAFTSLLSRGGQAPNPLVSLMLGLMFLAMQCSLINPLYWVLAVMISLWGSVAYLKIFPENHTRRIVLFYILFTALYHLAGGPVIIFAVMAILHEGRNDRVMTRAIFLIGSVVIIWLFTVFCPNLSWINTIESLPSADQGGVAGAGRNFIMSLPHITFTFDPRIKTVSKVLNQGAFLFILLSVTGGYCRQSLKQKMRHTGNKTIESQLKTPFDRWPISSMFALVLLVWSVAFFFLDRDQKALFEMDYYANRGHWRKVQNSFSQISSPQVYDFKANHDLNRALAAQGLLGERMFEFPQRIDSLFLLKDKSSLKSMELYLKIGQTAKAEKIAYEALENTGDHPDILETLAVINLLKGNTETAVVFLKALSRNLVEGDRGRTLLKMIQKDPELNACVEIQALKKNALDTDQTNPRIGADYFWTSLLEKNPSNRLAFEYMMAYYLLTCQTDKIAANIHRLDDFGYKKLPRYYEEALVIYGGPKSDRGNLPQRWRPGADAVQRALAFDRIESRLTNNPQRARQALAKDFGQCYYYYYMFKISGVNCWEIHSGRDAQ